MALSYRTRRRLSALILVIGLPAYVVAAVSLADAIGARFGRLPFLAELALYLGLGLVWILPLRAVFRGIGRPDPEAPAERPEDRSA